MKWKLWKLSGVAPALALAALAVAGCASPVATGWPTVDAVDHGRTEPDHEQMARVYEHQAAISAGAARRHEGYAAVYRRNTSPISGPQEHLALAEHCDRLAAAYQQAADESLALAKLHRRLNDQRK